MVFYENTDVSSNKAENEELHKKITNLHKTVKIKK